MKNKYVIIDLRTMDYFKNDNNEIIMFEDLEHALDTCGIYEFDDAWVCKLVYNHKE